MTQRFEVFKTTVENTGARSKVNRNVVDEADLETRMTNIERKLTNSHEKVDINYNPSVKIPHSLNLRTHTNSERTLKIRNGRRT